MLGVLHCMVDKALAFQLLVGISYHSKSLAVAECGCASGASLGDA